MRRTTFISVLIACVAMVVVAAPAASAKGGVTRTIALKGSISFPGATGKATSKVKAGERELEIDLQHIRALAGKHVNVNVNGSRLASPLVSSLGHFSVNRNTGAGQHVPPSRWARRCCIRTLGGTLIADGTF